MQGGPGKGAVLTLMTVLLILARLLVLQYYTHINYHIRT